MDEARMRPLTGNRLKFECRKDLSCFTRCCANLNLVLTPYDIIRIKKRLDLPSNVFLDTHTTASTDEAYGVPVVKLRMNEDDNGRCPFVTQEGCRIYEDRPGACRVYPLGRAASKVRDGHKAGEYYFIVKEAHCLGFDEDREWTVEQWTRDQSLDEYNRMNDAFLDITAGRLAGAIRSLSDQKLKMFYMACYSVDDFRRFVFETTFLKRFDLPEDVLERIRTDDIELMDFACRWLKFSLFGEGTLPVSQAYSAV